MLSAMTQTSCILRQNNFELTIPAEAGKVCLHNLSTSPVLFPKERGFANPSAAIHRNLIPVQKHVYCFGFGSKQAILPSSFQAGTPVGNQALEYFPEWPTCYGQFCL
jgi:hypothetical protein